MLLPLPTPFAAGLGQRAEAARSRLLWDADFRTMPRQVLPTTQLAWQALIAGGYSGAAAAPALSNAWIFNAMAVGDVPDLIGGKTLADSPAVGIPNVVGRQMVGLVNTVSDRWHRCAEWRDGMTAHFAAPLTTDFDPGSASWAMLVVFRHGEKPPSQRAMVSKYTPGAVGWRLVRTATGAFRFDVGTLAQITFPTGVRDSAPHYIFVRINRATNQLEGFTDMGAVTPASIAGAPAITSAVSMRVGGPRTGHHVNTTAAWQCAWMGLLTGADAEAITSTHLDRFWQHATRPAVVGVFNRGVRILTEIEDDPVKGVRLAGWQAGQFAWERDASFGGYGLGASVHGDVTNLLADSMLSGPSWTKNDMSVFGGGAEAPNGIDEAEYIEGETGANTARATVALNAGDLLQFSIYAGLAVAADAQLVIGIYDATFTTLKVQVTEDVGTAWKRVTLGGGWTADATANFGIQVSVQSNNDRICAVWGAQARKGDYDGPLAFSDGAAASCPSTDMRVTGAAAAILRAEEGELVAEYSCAAAVQATDRFVVDVSNAGSNVNRRAIKVAAGGVTTLMYDSGAVDRAGPVLAAGDQELLQHQAKRAELAWVATRFLLPTFRARLRMPHDAEADAGGVITALAYSDTVTTAWLGQNQANALPLNGVLRRVRCYGAAAP